MRLTDQTIFIERIVRTVYKHNLTHLVLFLLEVGRPFTFLGGQLLWVAQPALGLFVSRRAVGQIATLLEEPAAVDQLVTQLEALTET